MKHSCRGTMGNNVVQPGDLAELELEKDAAAWHSQSLSMIRSTYGVEMVSSLSSCSEPLKH